MTYFFSDTKEGEKAITKKIIDVLEEEILLKDIFNLEQVGIFCNKSLLTFWNKFKYFQYSAAGASQRSAKFEFI